MSHSIRANSSHSSEEALGDSKMDRANSSNSIDSPDGTFAKMPEAPKSGALNSPIQRTQNTSLVRIANPNDE